MLYYLLELSVGLNLDGFKVRFCRFKVRGSDLGAKERFSRFKVWF